MMDQKEYFRSLGFRCIEPIQVKFLDGSIAIVAAFGYLQHLEKEYPELTECDKRPWKLYAVARKNQIEDERINELELEKRIGIEAFNQLN
jgi:hypothetical protein